jgi:hypothetical protein
MTRFGIAVGFAALMLLDASAITVAAPQTKTICPMVVIPVCGTKDGARKTYTNSCFAAADHATHVVPGACHQTQPPQHFCPMIYQPVCGVKAGVTKTYGNSCQANAAGARIISQGQCIVPRGHAH